MDIKLSSNEIRVIACLIEKEKTTPDQYPLSLNALTNACNQKSNREPVMSLNEATVQNTLDALIKKRLVVEKSPFGGRTAKYQHRFCNTEFSDLKFSAQELGILCVLFMRGPQTPGELRTRTNRLCEFSDVNEVEQVLEHLATYQGTPLVRKLARQPGKREARYAHLFGDTEPVDNVEVEPEETAITTFGRGDLEQRILTLEQEMNVLRSELNELKQVLQRPV